MFNNKIKTGKIIFLAAVLFLLAGSMVLKGVSASSVFKMERNTLVSYQGKAVSVTIPKQTKKIGKSAFAGNKKITEITIKKGMVSIQDEAFKKCTKLKKIKIPVTVKHISSSAFNGCNKVVINAPKKSYALEFAKKQGIAYKITGKNEENEDNNKSVYGITKIECYWYTAGTFPCIAQKKVITDPACFDKLYELLLSLNSGEELSKDDIMIDGGQVLRVIVHFSGKKDLVAECNLAVYTENGNVYKASGSITPVMFWEQAEGEITETEL